MSVWTTLKDLDGGPYYDLKRYNGDAFLTDMLHI
jgi:hypothetical protein